MSTFHTLAETLMQAADLDLPELRGLTWGWQTLVRPGGERLRPDSLARMLEGLPVPVCDELDAHAACIALLPSALWGRGTFGADKVADLLRHCFRVEERSPFAWVRTWSGLPNDMLAAQLGVKPGRLRELCRAPWSDRAADGGLVLDLAGLGAWFGSNAVRVERAPCTEAIQA